MYSCPLANVTPVAAAATWVATAGAPNPPVIVMIVPGADVVA